MDRPDGPGYTTVPVVCSTGTLSTIARCVQALADELGPRVAVFASGEIPPGEDEGPEGPVRFVAGDGIATAFVVGSEVNPTGDGEPSFLATISFRGRDLENAARGLLARWDAADNAPAARGALVSLLERAPFVDTEPALAARLLLSCCEALDRDCEAAREFERTRIGIRHKLEQTERSRAYLSLARGLAHHFNNRLAVIMARAGLVALSSQSDVARNSAEQIVAATRSCCDFLGRFNSYALRRPVNGLDRDVLDDVVEQAVSNLEGFIAAMMSTQGIRIDVVLDLECSVAVSMPAEDLQAAVEALVSNAAEAMPDGGTLRVTTRSDHGWAVLEVTDTGVGMPAPDAGKLFNPFYTTKGATHAGLSLTYVQATVVQHGGSIEVATEEGRGAQFTVRIPGQGLTSHAMPAIEHRALAGPVLVVEDEDDVRTAICDLLEAMGYEVLAAKGGRAAELMAASREVGLVLTDLGVPDLSAFELARRLRGKGVEAPIVVLTGWVQEVDTSAASEAGIDLVLTKPIGADDLRAALRSFGVSD